MNSLLSHSPPYQHYGRILMETVAFVEMDVSHTTTGSSYTIREETSTFFFSMEINAALDAFEISRHLSTEAFRAPLRPAMQLSTEISELAAKKTPCRPESAMVLPHQCWQESVCADSRMASS